LLRKLLKRQCRAPRVMITDKLGSYSAAKVELMPGVEHRRHKGLNNRAENSHQPTRRRERQMKRFKSARQAQRFLSAHDQINNLFHLRRDRVPSGEYRAARGRALIPSELTLGFRISCAASAFLRSPRATASTDWRPLDQAEGDALVLEQTIEYAPGESASRSSPWSARSTYSRSRELPARAFRLGSLSPPSPIRNPREPLDGMSIVALPGPGRCATRVTSAPDKSSR
jgi:hypothetical protein